MTPTGISIECRGFVRCWLVVRASTVHVRQARGTEELPSEVAACRGGRHFLVGGVLEARASTNIAPFSSLTSRGGVSGAHVERFTQGLARQR